MRQKQLLSAMQDEGDASWSYQRDGRAKPGFKQIKSQLKFSDREAKVSYLTKKLRLQEGKRIGDPFQ